MRTVYIDLTRDETGQRDKINVGYTGEHNATELVIRNLAMYGSRYIPSSGIEKDTDSMKE